MAGRLSIGPVIDWRRAQGVPGGQVVCTVLQGVRQEKKEERA